MVDESLGEKRDRFTRELAAWILDVAQLPGYALRLCEVLRSDEQAEINALGADGRKILVDYLMPRFPQLAAKIANNTGSGIRTSVHMSGLAADLQLFVDGLWITDSGSLHWIKIGEMWERRGKSHRWGGRFPKPDGNHISFEHEGHS